MVLVSELSSYMWGIRHTFRKQWDLFPCSCPQSLQLLARIQIK